MKKLLLASLGVWGVLLMAVAVWGAPTQASEIAWHGTPDPNATPEVTGDEVTFVPTYYRDIQPLIAQHCLNCHAEGGIGAERIRLDDPATVQHYAEDIAFATGTRYMPPWLPGEASPPLRHERKLSEEEIALLDAWHHAGAPLGEATSTPASLPATVAFEPDLSVQLAEPYTPDENLNDDYRCFLLDPGLTEDTFITGYYAEPDQPSIVHHVLVFHLPAMLKSRAERLDAQDEKAGWQCFGSSGVGDDTVIGAWAPGTLPVIHPAGTGYPIAAGDLFIIQVHYFLEAGAKPDQTRVLFQQSAPGEELTPLYTAGITAPVEIPCPAEIQTEECTREGAIEYSRRYYGARARAVADSFLGECGKTARDYIHQDAANVTSFCDLQLPFDVTVVDILPHMHTRGTSIRVEVNPSEPDAQILIDIPRWDFHWQGVYQYETPIEVARGQTVRITCTWDNTRDDNPRYILWGEGTEDEMCLAYFTILAE